MFWKILVAECEILLISKIHVAKNLLQVEFLKKYGCGCTYPYRLIEKVSAWVVQ